MLVHYLLTNFQEFFQSFCNDIHVISSMLFRPVPPFSAPNSFTESNFENTLLINGLVAFCPPLNTLPVTASIESCLHPSAYVLFGSSVTTS